VDRGEQRIAVEELQVSRYLLNSVDFAPALDLDGDVPAASVAAHDVDRADRRRVLTADQPPAVA
jgi:hypothetical protein